MKIRTGFVSNSSSSSFMIHLQKLTETQKNLIFRHEEFSNSKFYYGEPCHNGEEWDIRIIDGFLKGRTGMDNFDICEYLENIVRDMTVVEFTEY